MLKKAKKTITYLGEYLVSPSYLLTSELEESEIAFAELMSDEVLSACAGEEIFFFSGDLKVSF